MTDVRIIFYDHNRRYKVIEVPTALELKKSGLHDNWKNCRDKAFAYVARRKFTTISIVHDNR